MKYTFTHGDGNDCVPGTITKDFTTDEEARVFARKLIKDGFRNRAWASVELTGRQQWTGRNVHGRVVARTT